MAHILRPLAPLDLAGRPAVFLAGSIDKSAGEPWQVRVASALADLDVVVLDPRRDDWDSSWNESIHDSRFREQVEWELAGLERAMLVAMYFAPTSKAPVTLLELGLSARQVKLVVCCPDGFWRKGNVEVVCARYNVPLVDDLAGLVAEVRRRLGPQGDALG
jgi:hypothetical protein